MHDTRLRCVNRKPGSGSGRRWAQSDCPVNDGTIINAVHRHVKCIEVGIELRWETVGTTENGGAIYCRVEERMIKAQHKGCGRTAPRPGVSGHNRSHGRGLQRIQRGQQRCPPVFTPGIFFSARPIQPVFFFLTNDCFYIIVSTVPICSNDSFRNEAF